MKNFLITIIISISGFANANEHKNIVTMHLGNFQFQESGSATEVDAVTGDSKTLNHKNKFSPGVAIFSYQRRIDDSVYLGFSLGNNDFKGISIGFGF